MDRKVPNTDYYLFKSAKDENLHQSLNPCLKSINYDLFSKDQSLTNKHLLNLLLFSSTLGRLPHKNYIDVHIIFTNILESLNILFL